MSAVVAAARTAVAGPYLSTEKLRGALLWLIGFSGAFVFIEPSPYEYVGIIGIALFVLNGISLNAALTPLILLLVMLNIGYASAVVQVSNQPKAVTWVLISVYLATTAIFYAAMLGAALQRRLDLLMRGYVAAALIAAFVAVAAYFHLMGSASDTFVLYDRARGTFNDPNVLGAFLVLPSLLMFRRLLAGRRMIRSTLMLLIMLAALFLSFSRGAWGQFALAATLVMSLTFITSSSVRERFRVVLIAVLGVLVIAGAIVALLSISQVADLFAQRANLEQSYDFGRYGRFGRYSLGFDTALEHPFGIGPLQFYLLFTEDAHNTFLNDFMSGGWLAGFAYLTLSLVTLAMSTRFVFVRTPWQPIYHVVYAAYVGTIAESAIIDIDHWRHYFLILGVLWGLMAASRPYLRAPPATVQRSNQAPRGPGVIRGLARPVPPA
jgi:hypothetical protein